MSSNDERYSQHGAAASVNITARPHRERPSRSISPSRSRSSRGERSDTSEAVETREQEPFGSLAVEGGHSSHGSLTHKMKKSGGFLLDSAFANGHPRRPDSSRSQGKKSEPVGNLQINKRTPKPARLPTGPMPRSSPLSREVPIEDTSYEDISNATYEPRPMGLDPAQLVQMALNLSESRKRHVSGTLPVPTTPTGGRRVVTGSDAGYGTAGSIPSATRRVSRFGENALQLANPQRSTQLDSGVGEFDAGREESVLYRFSPATLSRAERAQKYFELAGEHRRLLEHLPALKANEMVSGPSRPTTDGGFASANTDNSRSPPVKPSNPGLSRSYNPLQTLRNRRLRNRERQSLPTPPDAWQDLNQTRAWIDSVADAAANEATFRSGKGLIRLPKHPAEVDGVQLSQPDHIKAHQRTDTASSIITRPENGWTVEPAELLADTYWMEKGINKSMIQDKNGDRVFPALDRPSVDYPRLSMQEWRNSSEADLRSENEGSEDDANAKYRQRAGIPIFGRTRRSRLPHLSHSNTSLSSAESSTPPRSPLGYARDGGENTGPLERHMREMIDKDQRGELSSPETTSPDHWDSMHTQVQALDRNVDRVSRGPLSQADGELSFTGSSHRRATSADGRLGSVAYTRPTIQIPASNMMNSAFGADSRPSSAITSSPQMTKGDLLNDLKPKSRWLPDINTPSKRHNAVERNDFAEPFTPPLSPKPGGEYADSIPPRSSLDSRRTQVKRHKTTESVASSLLRFNTATSGSPTENSTKDPGRSLGRRILKGGRIGEIVRNEGSRLNDRLRVRDRGGDSHSLLESSKGAFSFIDLDDEKPDTQATPVGPDFDSAEFSTRESFERTRPKMKGFFSNLPSFRSPPGRTRTDGQPTLLSDGESLGPGQRLQRDNMQLPRLNQLAPPRLSLTDDDTFADSQLLLDIYGSRIQSGRSTNPFALGRKSDSNNDKATLGLPDIANRDNGRLSTGALLDPRFPNGQPRWSISDQAQTRDAKGITTRDIDRVRTLLLASGIKAHEILRKSNAPRNAPLPVIGKAIETTGQDMRQVPVREEHVVIARALSTHVSTSLSESHNSLMRFHTETAKTLTYELDNLQYRVRDQLTQLVHDTSDEADAFNVELTTKQPQSVKRVDDAVDAILRQRRRRFRLFRHAGFKMLEWLVLSIMWWLWFVVILFKAARGLLCGFLAFLRWLLWF